MEWNSLADNGGAWSQPIANLEAKQVVAKRLAERLSPGDVVGVGSGSTAFVAIQAIAARAKQENLSFVAVPTSHEVGLACANLNIPTTSLAHKRPDWSFDGCDEVDNDHNMIKGRGGAMFKEKMLIRACPEVYILVDESKLVEKLGQKFPVPIEIYPEALSSVTDQLTATYPDAKFTIRAAGAGKDGPIVSEAGNLIVDGQFPEIGSSFERDLKSITGVIETGLFWGFNFELLTA